MFVPVYLGIYENRKFKRLKRLLKLDDDRALGRLVKLWHHAMAHRPDGVLVDYDADDIADAAGWDGDPEEFVHAMLESGWLEATDTEALACHDWPEYGGKWITKKQANMLARDLHESPELVRAIRERDGDRCRFCAVTVNWKDRKGPAGGTYAHVTPAKHGGPTSLANVVVSCRACLAAKGDRTPEDWGFALQPIGGEPTPDGSPVAKTDSRQIPTEKLSGSIQDNMTLQVDQIRSSSEAPRANTRDAAAHEGELQAGFRPASDDDALMAAKAAGGPHGPMLPDFKLLVEAFADLAGVAPMLSPHRLGELRTLCVAVQLNPADVVAHLYGWRDELLARGKPVPAITSPNFFMGIVQERQANPNRAAPIKRENVNVPATTATYLE